MGYKKITGYISATLLSVGLIIFFTSCSDKEKDNAANTYYIEIVNCPDSIKQPIMASFIGKVSYYDENKMLKVMSVNYATGDHSGMHYYRPSEELGENIKTDTKKIRIGLSGNYTYDSTFYSIERFKYMDQQWKKISDMGSIQAISNKLKTKKIGSFDKRELADMIVQTAASATYE